jgi:prevent-host-death family protein
VERPSQEEADEDPASGRGEANFSQLIDQVVKRDEQILIMRNGRPVAVLVSANEYDSLCETVAIRSDRELMGEIRQGLRGLKGGAKIYTLEELLPED